MSRENCLVFAAQRCIEVVELEIFAPSVPDVDKLNTNQKFPNNK